MTNSISFKELVKLIHPDTNPNIQDAGAKMNFAVRYKNNPIELYKLGLKWGVIQRPEPQYDLRWVEEPTPQPRQPVFQWKAFFSEIPRVGDTVVVTTKGMMRAYVIKTTNKRVYFRYNGKVTYTSKDKVYVIRRVRVN